MRFIILTFFIVVLTLPFKSFAALDYGKQSLVGADFSGSDLKGATFYLTDLQDANLSGCELQNATLYGAKLKDTNLSNSNLREVTLDSAVLDGTDLSNTNLEDSFAYSTQFENVKIQAQTSQMFFCQKILLGNFVKVLLELIQLQIEKPEKL